MNKLTFFYPKKLNFGSFLILIMEIKYLKQILIFKDINFIFYSKNFNKSQFNCYIDVFNSLNLGFKKNSFKYSSKKIIEANYLNYTNLFKKNSTYSFEVINFFYKLTKIKPNYVYKKHIKSKIKRYILKKNIRKVITIHLKHDPENNLAHVKYNNWLKAFQKIKLNNKFRIFIVGNTFAKKYLGNFLDNVIFCNDKFSLSDQMYLVSISDYYIGMASGFCCAANFSTTPYLIIKHPDHHKNFIKDELSNGKIPFSNKKQKIIFMNQGINNILKILRNIR